MSKISSHFYLEEFVPKELFSKFGDKSIWFIDQRIIDISEVLRQRFNKAVIINNWHSSGAFNNRGFRMPDCPIGGFLSQHKRGNAIDVNVGDLTPQEVYKDLIENFSIYSKAGLTTVEDIALTTGWCHIDTRLTKQDSLLIIKP